MMESILNRLETTREKMIQSAIENGVTNRETIRLSEELDHLLNEFHSQVKQHSTSEQLE
ncbi:MULTISPECIES: aspartyl-phosphate phosphatase Spo0E family protein [Psychrobacillus]|uniref:Aspartyl-phosphate phosphatase Spo0E family protein n=1 Tax=Psychrobacillus faecigallinarum TaxID=2762235 RepID=A0ABR8R5G2_9BACI|nr:MULTISPECIES: aspartyl-phosphate phosphatase Spo0E family protein [Psychrobacillus]MBD7942912.1 aspartyl-phosphate phosphatase Spo0E family protein [Psychrobacillus faecigallinarum]QEY20376.1 aspartyl-phosphate phosphatase Spo0E family protein [Psychrobacillus sp. AK 1817]QGM30911.1 Spo0E family sporulation regulatory protein-aspartic acid phosphatase [Bacillus sp. N3536]